MAREEAYGPQFSGDEMHIPVKVKGGNSPFKSNQDMTSFDSKNIIMQSIEVVGPFDEEGQGSAGQNYGSEEDS